MKHLLFVLIVIFPSTLFAQSYKVGDKVVATSFQPLKVQDKEVDKVFPGLVMRVGVVNGEWLWVGQAIPGWLEKQHVISFDRGIDYFTEKVRREPKNVTWLWARAVVWKAKGEYDIAISDFNEIIRLKPKSANAYNDRGTLWLDKSEFDNAIDDITEAIRLDPSRHFYYANRGDAWSGKGDFAKALSDYSEAIRREPKNAHAFFGRGNAHSKNANYEKALADFNESIRLHSTRAKAYNGRAWLRSTCNESKYRDGEKAFADAKKACGLTNYEVSSFIDTLAATYAENGNFDEAIKWQEKAIELAPDKAKADLRARLELYKSGKPYREKPKK